jgi:hydrogenase-1 operon protein HyaF
MSATTKALLSEMLELLIGLAEGERGGAIDLRALPLAPDELALLRDFLGTGAVEARIDACGLSHAVETRFPGLWWVTHYGADGDPLAEIVEIADFPALARPPAEDIGAGIARLRKSVEDAP